ncbi:MAG: alpha-amylase family glycosyl hydrolase [Candidatus Margulisbacteria bacterium]|nr:alpha-amylase family glycosyl hydrolase [Candidatus Margulisiibacteriota bacterium]
MSKRGNVLIYNLFPRLTGAMTNWPVHFKRAKQMGFNWVYINPIQYPGFSGSLYSIKDYYRINPLFLKGRMSEDNQVRNMIHRAHLEGLKVIFDLVINHTAIDSVLVEQHPSWYQRNSKGIIKNPQVWEGDKLVCTWGDLAEIDNESSVDRDNLWKYWLDLIRYFIKLGVDGFRCDAAYQVPVELWEHLIGTIHAENKKIVFFAETLGCEIEDVIALAKAGFDYNFNSSKWWDFKEEWCLKQYRENAPVSPSIAFAESHDTPRLAAELKGNEAAIKMRYLFSAIFSTGVMMPIGLEYGFKESVNVVKTLPEDWEPINIDLVDYVTVVNSLKKKYKVFKEDSKFVEVWNNNDNVFSILKISNDGTEKALIIINKDTTKTQHVRLNIVEIMEVPAKSIVDVSVENAVKKVTALFEKALAPAQVTLLLYHHQPQ